MLLEAGRQDTGFVESLRAYLEAGYQQNPALLKLFAGLADKPNTSREQLLLAETALELQLKTNQEDEALNLELARIQERLGKENEALASYTRLSNPGRLTGLEGELGAVRLLARSREFAQAEARLEQMRRNLLEYQSEIDYQSSLIYREQNDLEKALQFAKRAGFKGQQRPQRTSVYRHNIAGILRELGKAERAEQELTELLADYPDYAEAYYELGKLQMERGALEEALPNFQKAVSLNGASPHYLYELGKTFLSQNRFTEAYSYLHSAIQHSEARPDYYAALGLAALKLGRPDEARATCEEGLQKSAAEDEKLNPVLLVYLGAADLVLGDKAAARSSIFRAAELEASNPLWRLLCGVVAEAASDTSSAGENYLLTLRLAGEIEGEEEEISYQCNLRIARLLRLNKDVDNGYRYCSEAEKMRPSDPRTLFEAGLMALEKREFQTATEYFGKGVTALETGQTVADGETSRLLALFGANEDLSFELPYHMALCLREQGLHEQSQKMLRGLLAEAEKSGRGNLNHRRAAVNYQLGRSLFDQQNLREALPNLRMAVAEEPANALYRLWVAKAWQQGGDTDRALTELNLARELSPDMPEVYAEIAETQLIGKALEPNLLLACLNQYLKALSLAPGQPQYLLRAGLLAYRLDYRNQTTELLQKLGGKTAAALLLSACLSEREGKLEEARSAIEKALDTPETLEQGYYLVAARLSRKTGALDRMELYLRHLNDRASLPLELQAALRYEEGVRAMNERRYLEATGFFRLALDLRQKASVESPAPRLEEIYYNDGDNDGASLETVYRLAYGEALSQLGRYEQAQAELQNVVETNPELPQAHSLLGDNLRRQGHHHEALPYFKRAVVLQPVPARHYQMGLASLRVEGMHEDAIASLERATTPELLNNATYHEALGQAYRKANRLSEARASLTRALQLEPKNAELHLELANAYSQEGDRLSAVQPLQEAVMCEPENPAYRFELANLFEELTWLPEAATEYKKATDLNPGGAKAWLKSGQVLVRTGKLEQGQAALEKALSLDEELPEAHYELGRLYLRAAGITEEAVTLPPDLQGMFGPAPLENKSEVTVKGTISGTEGLEQARLHLNRAVELNAHSQEYFYELARAEFQAGNYQSALTACERAMAINPNHYEACLLQAEAQMRLEEPQEAWNSAQQAIKLYKHREEAWLSAARAASQAGRDQRAIETLDLYLRLNRGQIIGPLAYILLARTQLNLKNPEKSLEQLEFARARMKAMFTTAGPAFLTLQARIMRALNKPEEALESYKQALQIDPQNPALHNELGEAYQEQSKLDESIKAFRQALQIEPENALYHYNAGVAALGIVTTPGQYQRRAEAFRQHAVDYLTKATALNPIMPQYWYELSRAHSVTGNYRKMQQSLQQAITRSPAFADSEAPQVQYMRDYALACMKLGDIEGARETLNKILATLPQDHQSLNDLGEVEYRLGNYQEAYNYYRRAEVLANDHPRYLANMSRALLRLNRLQEARELVEEAVQSGEDHYVSHQHGAVLLEFGNAEEALEKLKEAAQQDPSNPEFRYYLGRAYLEMNMIAEAAQEFQEAVALAPTRHQWHAELGEAYLKDKAFLPALESFRMASQLDQANFMYRYNLAVAMGGNGEAQQAIYIIRDALDALGSQAGAEWHYLLGRMLSELHRYEDALESFAKANELEPYNPIYKVDFAKTLRLKGEYGDNVRYLLEEAIADNPGELRSVEELAYLYEATEDLESALQTMKPGIELVLEKALERARLSS
jgi:tetratricopeptide (TPR) repeat protein